MSRKILLVEDDSSLGATLKERLEKAQYQVRWCQSISAAQEAIVEQGFDLMILDVGLPDGSGFDFAKRLRLKTAAPFIFVTARSTAEDRLLGYDLGAVEYIPKPFHLREFMMRVEHALGSHSPPAQMTIAGVIIDSATLTIERDGHKERLAARDFKLLQLLIERSPQIVSRDEILNSLWSEDEFPSNRTVDNVILRLRQALGPSVGTMINSVRSVGYQWLPKGEGNE